MIVDAHLHVFPSLHGPCGFTDKAEHLRFLQLYIGTHGEPARRLRDHTDNPAAEAALHDGALAGPDGLKHADFRVGRFGRFEWEYEGETYYRSFLPPSLQEMVCPPEFISQAMARAGVQRAVLQNARLYGRLNEAFSNAAQTWPETFIGLADVREHEADSPNEIARLVHAVKDLGLRGLYYATRGHFLDGYRRAFDDPAFDPYWETVRDLGIPVFWEILGTPLPTTDAYLRELDRLVRWSERYPEIPSILTHGLPPDLLDGNEPEPVARLLKREQISIEILYPIYWGRTHTYPYLELAPTIRRLYDLAGPARLIWGSDMPNVERNCTYRQSLDYLFQILPTFASGPNQAAILGENVLELLGPDSPD